MLFDFFLTITLQTLSRNPIYTNTFDEKDPKKIAHIDLADWAEIAIIAPATAYSLRKIANGLGDDMLTTTLLATRRSEEHTSELQSHGHLECRLLLQIKMRLK